MQGHTDIPLNETGFKQAQQVALYCKKFASTLTGIYASDLQRAWQTAEEIAREVSLNVTRLSGLREFHGGKVEGLTREDRIAQFGHGNHDEHFGETSQALIERVHECLMEIDVRHKGSLVIAVTHSGVIRTLIRHLSDVNEEALSVHNCCVVEFHALDDQNERRLVFMGPHSY
jgi:probable phosphoglycerate mutase